MRNIENIDPFTNEIINQAKKEAEAIIDRAKRAAEHDIRFAREDAEAIREEYKAKTKKLAIQEERKVYTQARQEARRKLWQKKQELLSKAFDEAEKKVKEFRNSSNNYRDSVIALAKEGVDGIGDGNMKILVNPEDAEFFTDELLSEIGSSLPRVKLEVHPESKISAGVIVTSDDERIIFDNSYAARLERVREELRGKVAELLLEEHNNELEPAMN